MFKTVTILLAVVVYLALAGCGTKGPLYIPEQRYPQGVEKDVGNGATKNDAPATNIDVPSRPAP